MEGGSKKEREGLKGREGKWVAYQHTRERERIGVGVLCGIANDLFGTKTEEPSMPVQGKKKIERERNFHESPIGQSKRPKKPQHKVSTQNLFCCQRGIEEKRRKEK
jgi:hypothetical protein